MINITRFRKTDDDAVYSPRNWFQLLVLLLRLKCDIVHLHIGGSVTPRLLALSLGCCMMPRRKAVLTFHSGGYPDSREGQSARPCSMRGFVFRRFERIIAVNSQIMEIFFKFGCKPDRVQLIYPFALEDAAQDYSLPENLSAFIESHYPVMMTVGLLEPEYDLTLQIETLGLLREKYPRIGLMIVGSGSLEGALRKEISAKPYACDILVCGDTPHRHTLGAMRACAIFLRTTLFDGDSVAVREAIHSGIPVIATNTGSRPPGVHLIHSPNPAMLAQAIEEVLGRPASSQNAGEANNDNIEAVLRIYKDLLGEH